MNKWIEKICQWIVEAFYKMTEGYFEYRTLQVYIKKPCCKIKGL